MARTVLMPVTVPKIDNVKSHLSDCAEQDSDDGGLVLLFDLADGAGQGEATAASEGKLGTGAFASKGWRSSCR